MLNAQSDPKEWVSTFQRKLYCAAKLSPSRRFGVLHDKLYYNKVLHTAWSQVRANRGRSGIDGNTIKYYEDEYGVERLLGEIADELKSRTYHAPAVRRAYIAKPGRKEKRPLGVPTVKDRIVQAAVKLIVEPLYEADFLDCSYGFRPKRSGKQAATKVHKLINTHKWFVDVDLKSYFDTIPHDRLMECVRKRISDKRVLYLIRSWLKAGVLEDGRVCVKDKGSPQGGVLSPLLSNIYLHELDSRWDSKMGHLFRYADDMVILCRSQKQAEASMRWIEEVVHELGLELNTDKTHMGHIREGFDFVGFTFREGPSPKTGKMVRSRMPRKQSRKNIRHNLKETLKGECLGRSLEEIIPTLNRSIRGWAQYFRGSQCYQALLDLHGYVCEQLRIFMRRRHKTKRTRGYNRWSNTFFCRKGLVYAPSLR
jgi:group II intron reverse transcriptase/maturase